MSDRILICRARPPQHALDGKEPLPLGVCRKAADGWRFAPLTSAHRHSRKGHATLVKALPGWVGGLNRTESIGMLPGESIPAALRRIAADRARC